MRNYMKRSAIIMVSVLVLSGCSSQKTVPSLENAGNMTEEQLRQELSKFSREEINAAWGEETDSFSGRMGAAVKDTTFVFLSNIKDITFEQAWKASGLSSNMDDYFKEEDAKFVAVK